MTNAPATQEQPLVVWARYVKTNTEQRLARAAFLAALNTAPLGGSFSSWLLAISGATVGLTFSNVESVLKIVSPGELRAAFGFLFASCAAGFAARIASYRVDLNKQIIVELEGAMWAILKDHEKEEEEFKKTAGRSAPPLTPNFQWVLEQFVECIPRFLRGLAMRGFEQGKADPLSTYKKAVRIYFRQPLWVGLQSVLFLVFFAVLCLAI